MKVVGLLSGGKDSCYNLVHCVQQGHELVALATLAPPGSKDELDSYMYQTVGHDAVHLVAAAMGLPLYRREIKGTAVNQRSEYGSRAPASSSSTTHGEALDDETEDLYHLLRDVKSHHPDVEAVSVGAILSNYQRVRVEHVALRPDIALTPLTFLWQRDQAQLYAEMLDARLVAVLIKVAGIGLDERDLGKTLGHMHTKLTRLAAMYGAHVCGEGGEYETLTIDSPLFRERIELRDVETVVHSDSGFGSVSYLRIKDAVLVPKDAGQAVVDATTPPLLDAVGTRTLAAARAAYRDATSTASAGMQELAAKTAGMQVGASSTALPPASVRRSGRYVVVSNVTGTDSAGDQVEDQVRAAFATVRQLLSTERLGVEHIAHVNLYVRSQTQFSRINAVYREQFGVSPPTRACVALPLPPCCELVLSIVAFDDAPAGGMVFDRRALHVQGRSFWAPANIGPYSQSLLVAEKTWVAGQIGLVPADLSLPHDAPVQAALSVQHARRIVTATVNDLGGRGVERGWVEGGLCWIEDADDVDARLEMARHAWLAQAEDDEGEEGGWMGKTESKRVGMLVVVLARAALPRGAGIEWQLTAHTGRTPPSVSAKEVDEDEVGADCDVDVAHTRAVIAGTELVHTITTSSAGQSTFGLLTLRLTSEDALQDEAFAKSIAALTSAYAVHLFLPPGPSTTSALSTLRHILPSAILDSAQHVPCTSLHLVDPTLAHVDVALTWHGI